MKTTNLTILFFLFLSVNLCFGQNYKEGYVIQTNGDTIRGFIKHQRPIVHSELVVFKKNKSDVPTKYSPNELSKYYFDGLNYYESDSIPFFIERNKVYYKELFVKKMVNGAIELYRLDYQDEECVSSEFQVMYDNGRAKKSKLSYGFNAGINSTKMTNLRPPFEEFDAKRGLGFSINAFIQSEFLNYFGIRGGLSYEYRSHFAKSDYVVPEYYDNQGEMLDLAGHIKVSQLKAPVQFIFRLPRRKITPYVYGGVYLGTTFELSSSIDGPYFQLVDGESLILPTPVDVYSQKKEGRVETGWSIGAGSEFRLENGQRLMAELEYQKGKNDGKKDGLYVLHINTITLKVGYIFSKQ